MNKVTLILVFAMCVATPAGLRGADGSPAVTSIALTTSTIPDRSEAPGAAIQRGDASWYGIPYHGRRAASGEVYDMEQLTAAHQTLPFGTQVRVRRLDTNQTVVVRINDRGPYVGERIIDLSYAAARRIGMVVPGVARVALELLGTLVPDPLARFAVQIGAFRVPESADRLCAELKRRYGAARIVVRHGREDLSAVLVGEANSQVAAEALAQLIRTREQAMGGAFVVRLDAPAAPSVAAE
jgi:rare lipoprotein A